jgi:hypothetical protein
MSSLIVTAQGLKHLAADCTAWSSEVAATDAPGTPAGSAQATAAAVSAVHADAGLAAEMLSARMRANAAKLTIAASAYAAQDLDCALDALAIGR